MDIHREVTGEYRGDSCTLVIFGASGDLTNRKLIPALFSLFQQGWLPKSLTVVGFGRTPMSHEAFRVKTGSAVHPDSEKAWKEFSRGLYYVSGDFKTAASFKSLAKFLSEKGKPGPFSANLLFYLATPPSVYPKVIENLKEAGLSGRERGEKGWTRIVIEKPFGRDLKTAVSLNRTADQAFEENQIFRMDHYLGKETVQNILAFRFANGIFEPIWNREYIDHIQITCAEGIGIEGRGAYYEEAGALRDMVQNHLLQLLALVAMEPPVALDADSIRDEKVKVWRAIRPIQPDQAGLYTILGQYGRGTVHGREIKGYREEEKVSPRSMVETYVAVKFFIDTWRWGGLPFYLRTGKRLPKRVTEIAIQFKKAPHLLFRRLSDHQQEPNVLLLKIQPDEGISLKFEAKRPGPGIQLKSETLDFHFDADGSVKKDSAYERLLLDAMRGDQTLFTRRDGVEAAWALIDPIIEGWKKNPPADFPNYGAETWGPPSADELIGKEGHRWRQL
ncbi:MAG: glucose-6-phosphate dehydrogenase [Nitrospirae bacterium]|nr:glucose-6-phosphate dehydrogenase [Nitrospirota bacterium]